MDGLNLIMIICIVIAIYIQYWIAKQFYAVACMKGYDEKKYLWIAFFFSVIGYLLVVALPSKSIAVNNKSKDSSNDLPDL